MTQKNSNTLIQTHTTNLWFSFGKLNTLKETQQNTFVFTVSIHIPLDSYIIEFIHVSQIFQPSYFQLKRVSQTP